MDEYLRGKISYFDLRQIIFNYFKEKLGLELSSGSIDYLKNIIGGEDPRLFFIVKGELGDTRFNISKEDIQKILKSYLASKNLDLTSIEYGYDVEFSYKQNPNINHENEEEVTLDITYVSSIRYEDLRKIIFDYYKQTKGVELGSISIDYLQDKLTGGNFQQPFFIRKDEFGETRFDIPIEEIQEILKSYLASKNYELEELSFDYRVGLKYKQSKKQEQKAASLSLEDSAPQFEPPKEPPLSVEEPRAKLERISQYKKTEPIPVKDEELERMAREKRRFTILQRERAMNEAQKGKNRSAIMAGICILGAAAAIYFNGQDINQVIQHELNSIYSWEALGQYIQDLGPLTTLLAVAASGFIAQYLQFSERFRKAQNEFKDFNDSLEENVKLGGRENAR